MRLYPDYDKIIIGVSNYGPKILEYEEIKKIFNDVFKYLPKYKVISVKGSVTERTIFSSLFDINFSIIVTGNQNTFRVLKEIGVPVRLIERTDGVWNRGTHLREIARRENDKNKRKYKSLQT